MRKFKLETLAIIMFLLCCSSAFSATDLNRAAYDGDVALVKQLLSETFDPDYRDSSGGTALHAAMFQKNMEVVTLLIDAGFDLNAQGSSNGYTPLHDAVWANNIEAAKLLLEKGAKTDIKAKDGTTAYDKAIKEGKTEIADLIKSYQEKSNG